MGYWIRLGNSTGWSPAKARHCTDQL